MITICLTATAYDGSEEGLEKHALDAMGYKVYYNSIKKEDYDPVVHKRIEFGTLEKIRTYINAER